MTLPAADPRREVERDFEVRREFLPRADARVDLAGAGESTDSVGRSSMRKSLPCSMAMAFWCSSSSAVGVFALADFLWFLPGRGDFAWTRPADSIWSVLPVTRLAFEDRVERRVVSTGAAGPVDTSAELSMVVTSLLDVGEDLVADRRVSLAVAAFFAGGAASSLGSDLRFCESTERSLVD